MEMVVAGLVMAADGLMAAVVEAVNKIIHFCLQYVR